MPHTRYYSFIALFVFFLIWCIIEPIIFKLAFDITKTKCKKSLFVFLGAIRLLEVLIKKVEFVK